MPTHIALLRGINVGGRNKVAMPALRTVVGSLGHTDVTTYIQSGNVLFTTTKTDTRRLASALERAIAEQLDVRPSVVVLTCAELARVVADNPYPDEADPRRVHAIFLGAEPGDRADAELADIERRAAGKGGRDTLRRIGRTVYLHTPDGYGRSELAAQLGRAGPAATGTARNWATVTKLLALCSV